MTKTLRSMLSRAGAIVLSSVTVFLVAIQPAKAVTFEYLSGNLGAQAVFTIDGSLNLQVVLTNTSKSDVQVPTDVLTGVFFNIAGNPTLAPQTALLTNLSTVFYDPDGQPSGGNVSGEWVYKANLVGAPASYGISSAGLHLFGPGDLFPGGSNLAGPTSPNGLEYGILSAGDDVTTGNGGILGSDGLIKNSATFVLGPVQPGFLLESVGGVAFQYGTSIAPIPEPEIYAMLLAGLGLMGFVAKRRKQQHLAG